MVFQLNMLVVVVRMMEQCFDEVLMKSEVRSSFTATLGLCSYRGTGRSKSIKYGFRSLLNFTLVVDL